MYIDEDRFKKGNEFDKLKKLEIMWDFFQQPLDSDVILENFGPEGMRYFSIQSGVNGSSGNQLVFINERAFEHPLCLGDFVSILWADGIKLRYTDWAIIEFYNE